MHKKATISHIEYIPKEKMLWDSYYKIYLTPKHLLDILPMNQQDYIDLLPFPKIEFYEVDDRIVYEADENGKIIWGEEPGIPAYLVNLSLEERL